MKKMKVLLLGILVKDTVTKTAGMLTHMLVGMGGEIQYVYQPKALDPKTGRPVDKICLHGSRITGGTEIEMDVRTDLLGEKAEDTGTGFKGTIIGLIYHLDGCLHVEIKPSGLSKQTNATLEAQEFDVRRVKGPNIPEWTPAALKKSIKETPSPCEFTRKS